MKKIILGISSGIAAYKISSLIRLLMESGYDVDVMMTANASYIISEKEIQQLTRKKVYKNLFEKQFSKEEVLKNKKVDHIDLADNADLIVIAPATANIISKLSHGAADDFLTTTVIAATSKVLVCPSMNSNMWANQIVQNNLNILKENGFVVMPPLKGPLACGYEGEGRLPDVVDIKKEIDILLKTTRRLKGKKIIVTAGGTYEPLDQVRGITNRASGKMGKALAEVCYKQGAEVLLIRTQSAINSLYPIKQEVYTTSKDLEAILHRNVPLYDAVFHTAAVSDFFPGNYKRGKIKSDKGISLKLKVAEKIISKIKKWNKKIKLIGFKAVYKGEIEEIEKEISKKMKEYQCDFFAVNDISDSDSGFNSDNNEIMLFSNKGKKVVISKDKKQIIAEKLVSEVFG